MSINRGVDVDPSADMPFLHSYRILFLFEGVVLVVLGCLAIVVPSISSSSATRWLGWLFFASGIVGLVTTFLARSRAGFWWCLISAGLAIIVSVVLVGNGSQDLYGGLIGWPLALATLGPMRKVLVLFFLIEGGASMMFAFEHSRHFSSRWGWMLVSGVIDIILAIIIMFNLPGTSAWTMGLLIGINMIMGGAALIAMGLQTRAPAK